MPTELSRHDLIDLVRKILECEGTEEQVDEWQDLLEENVPHPDVSALMFENDEDLTPEEIVDRALAYKPIQLPGSK